MDGNNAVVTESNGDRALGPDSGEIWPAEMDASPENASSLSLEEKAGLGAADPVEEEVDVIEEKLEEDHLNDQLLEEKLNFERLSPQSQLEGDEAEAEAEADPDASNEAIFIAPLDGSHAELRSRVIKEVRKPGRSEYEEVQCEVNHMLGTAETNLSVEEGAVLNICLCVCLCVFFSQTMKQYWDYCSRSKDRLMYRSSSSNMLSKRLPGKDTRNNFELFKWVK